MNTSFEGGKGERKGQENFATVRMINYYHLHCEFEDGKVITKFKAD